MTLFVQMFKYAAEPFFFSKASENNARMLYADVMTFFVTAGLFIFLMVTLFLEYFILFIGAGFREGVHIVPIILLANLMMGIFFNLSIWYKLTNKTIIGAILVIAGASITVMVNVIFIPVYGYLASAWAHLICYSFMVFLSYLWSRRHYPIPYRIGRIGIYIALALVIYSINRLFLQDAPKYSDLLDLVLLGFFGFTVAFRERSTFYKYKNG